MLEEFDGMNQWGLRGSGDQLKDFIFRLQEEKFARGERRRFPPWRSFRRTGRR